MTDLRIAIVGCGGITPHYAKVFDAFEWAQPVVCVDSDLAKARELAESFGKNNITVTDDFAEALRDHVNVVSINTPNHLHRFQAIAALEAGKNLLLQKPVAANLADACAIAEAAEKATFKGILSGLFLSYFDLPLIHDFYEMAQTGWFGEIAHLHARLMHRGGLELSKQALNGEKNWRGSIEQTGGGCFIQLAVHYIHIFEWLLNSKVTSISAVAKNLHCHGLEGEDLACAMLEFATGAVAVIETAWCAAGEQISISGTRGNAVYINNQMLMLSSDAGNFNGQVIKYQPPTETISRTLGSPFPVQTQEIFAPRPDDFSNEFNQIRRFLEAVRNHQKPFVSIQTGTDDMRVVAAFYESARTGKKVDIIENFKELNAVI